MDSDLQQLLNSSELSILAHKLGKRNTSYSKRLESSAAYAHTAPGPVLDTG